MVLGLSREKSDRRLYVDMMFRKTNMYANYLPETSFELGDYGDITKDGDFIKWGNIFKDHPELRDKVELGREPLASNKYFFASRTRRKNTFSTITECVYCVYSGEDDRSDIPHTYISF